VQSAPEPASACEALKDFIGKFDSRQVRPEEQVPPSTDSQERVFSEKSIQTESVQETVVYGEDRATRIGSGVFGLLMLGIVGVGIWILFGGIADASRSLGQDRILGFLITVLFLLMALCCAFYAGPNRLSIDFAKGVYTSTRGFLFFPKISSGPLVEIKEIYLRERNYQGAICWHMMAGWNQPGKPGFRLAIFPELDKAQEQARALAECFGAPADTKPRPWSGW